MSQAHIDGYVKLRKLFRNVDRPVNARDFLFIDDLSRKAFNSMKMRALILVIYRGTKLSMYINR